jgi:phytoene dehydrogenase-like protein
MPAARDVVIIGGGHNGLVTAFYLARAGRKPLVLERRPVVGGAAITDEFAPGFRCSTLSHATGPMRSEILRDMALDRHGVQWIEADTRVFAPAPDGRALVLHADPKRSAQEIARLSRRDAEAYVDYHETLGRVSGVIGDLLTMTPPAIDAPSIGELWALLGTGRKFRGLGRKDMFRLLRWGPMAVADLVAEWFETELLRGAIAGRGIFGTFLGPWSAGTTAVLLLRAAADRHAAGSLVVPKGGLGALTQAMAAAAREAGAEIRTGSEVARIAVKSGAVTGVVLKSGEEIPARAVVSNADPRRTFLSLIDPTHLEPDFLVKTRNYRAVGTVAKVNLALSGLPTFTALKSTGGAAGAGGRPGAGANGHSPLSGRIQIGPEIDYLERAFDDAKYGDFSAHPYIEATLPSIGDPSLAPPGQHVMSIYAQFAPYHLKKGDWRSRREELGDTVVKTLAAYAPDLPGKVVQGQVITPLDLEETYGLSGGHIEHGEAALDQLFTMRPLLGWARYRGPLKGLFLCGAGTHPGGGITGASGRNAAREILRDVS